MTPHSFDPIALAQRLEVCLIGLESLGTRREKIHSVTPYGGAVFFDGEPFFIHVVSLTGAPSTYDVTAAICRAFCLPPNELRWDLDFQYGPREHWASALITIVLALSYHEAVDLALARAGRELAEQQPGMQWLVITPTAIHHHAPEFLRVARSTPVPAPAA